MAVSQHAISNERTHRCSGHLRSSTIAASETMKLPCWIPAEAVERGLTALRPSGLGSSPRRGLQRKVMEIIVGCSRDDQPPVVPTAAKQQNLTW